MYPPDLPGIAELADQPVVMCLAGSVVVSRLGNVLTRPLFDAEGILCAEPDLWDIPRGRFDLDVTGHYARPNGFRLVVKKKAMPPLVVKEH